MHNPLEYTTCGPEKVLTRFPRGWGFAKVLGVFLSFAGLSSALHQAQGITLFWDRAASHTNLSAYVVKYGVTGGSYTGQVSVAASQTSATVNNLTPGLTYYFVVMAKDTSNVESDPSNQISYTVPAVNTGTVRVRVTPSRQVVLTVTGQPGHTLEIQATQNFTTWTVINTVTLGASGSMDVIDANAASFPRRFYRVRDTQ
jgi:hypothetical protein